MELLRVDKWLWAARFFKTRSLATQAVALGRVRLAGERIKPARALRVGDCLQIAQGHDSIEVVVRQLSEARGPAPIARALYEETAASVQRREQQRLARAVLPEPAGTRKGRPTKREGRQLRQWQGGDE